MQVRAAFQVVVAEVGLQRVRHVTDIEVRAVNAAAGEIVVQIRIGEAGGEQQILLDPGFGEGVDVERVIGGALPVGDLLFEGSPGNWSIFSASSILPVS